MSNFAVEKWWSSRSASGMPISKGNRVRIPDRPAAVISGNFPSANLVGMQVWNRSHGHCKTQSCGKARKRKE